MQKQLKLLHKIFFGVIFSLFVLLPIQAYEINENYIAKNFNNEQMQLIRNDVKVNDLDIEPIDTQMLKKTVVPDAKSEGKKVMELFVKVMIAVLIAAYLVYLILVFVKKYYGSAFVESDEDEFYEDLDMATPKNKQDALKSFLNRTRS